MRKLIFLMLCAAGVRVPAQEMQGPVALPSGGYGESQTPLSPETPQPQPGLGPQLPGPAAGTAQPSLAPAAGLPLEESRPSLGLPVAPVPSVGLQPAPAEGPAPVSAAPAGLKDAVRESKVSFLMDTGVQYADAGEYKDAERAYLRALESDPGNPDIRFRMGTLYIQMGQFPAAVEILEGLKKEFPDNPLVCNNLAWVYASGGKMRNTALALRNAREAILLAPLMPSVWNTLAEAYYVGGDYEKAARASDHAIELLRMNQNVPEAELQGFVAQRIKIERAAGVRKKLMGLGDEE